MHSLIMVVSYHLQPMMCRMGMYVCMTPSVIPLVATTSPQTKSTHPIWASNNICNQQCTNVCVRSSVLSFNTVQDEHVFVTSSVVPLVATIFSQTTCCNFQCFAEWACCHFQLFHPSWVWTLLISVKWSHHSSEQNQHYQGTYMWLLYVGICKLFVVCAIVTQIVILYIIICLWTAIDWRCQILYDTLASSLVWTYSISVRSLEHLIGQSKHNQVWQRQSIAHIQYSSNTVQFKFSTAQIQGLQDVSECIWGLRWPSARAGWVIAQCCVYACRSCVMIIQRIVLLISFS